MNKEQWNFLMRESIELIVPLVLEKKLGTKKYRIAKAVFDELKNRSKPTETRETRTIVDAEFEVVE